MKTLTNELVGVGAAGLPDCGPGDHRKRGLETVDDMARCRGQWRACIRHLPLMCICSTYYFAIDLAIPF